MSRRQLCRRSPILGTTTYLDPIAIFRLTPFVRQIVRSMGVRACDVKDVVQNALLGAWASMTAGRYRLRAKVTPNQALRAWVASIAIRQSLKWINRACYRREVPYANPCGPEVIVDHAGTRYDARETLRQAMRTLRHEDRAVLVVAAEGSGLVEIASILGIRISTAANRLRRVRERLDRIQKSER